MAKEYIWGCELNATKKVFEYDINEDESLDNNLSYSLLLKQATLGSNATDGQVNVVTIDSLGLLANTVSQPLFRLTAGKTEQCQLDILINHPGTKLTLIEGSGPVYILGQQLVELEDDEDSNLDASTGDVSHEVEDADESEEENEEDLKDELEFLNGDIAQHALGVSTPSAADKKNKRMASVEPERDRKVHKKNAAVEMEESNEDDEEEEEEEEETPQKPKKRKTAPAKKPKGKAAGKK